MPLIREEGFAAKVEKRTPFRAFHEILRNDKATICEFLGNRETIFEEAICREGANNVEDKRKSCKLQNRGGKEEIVGENCECVQ